MRYLIPIIALLVGCSTTAAPPAAAQDTWTVGCQDDQLDPYGKLVERSKCWAMVSYFGGGDSASIGVDTIFEIDARGARLVNNPDLDPELCPAKPTRIAVDGKRVDTLAMPARIDAVLAGARLTRERDRGWPYCNLMNETTTLTGARSAYEEMQAKWAARLAPPTPRSHASPCELDRAAGPSPGTRIRATRRSAA